MQYVHIRLILTLSLYSYSICGLANSNFQSTLKIQEIEAYGARLHNVMLNFDSMSAKSNYLLKIESAVIPSKEIVIKDITLRCNKGIVSKKEISCENGDLSFYESLINAKKTKFNFSRKKNGDLKLNLDQFNIADGLLKLNLIINQDKWELELFPQNVSLKILSKLLPSFSEWAVAGDITGKLALFGENLSLGYAQGDLSVNGFGFSNDESTVVAEEVAINLDFSTTKSFNQWRTQLKSTTYKGELYFDPVFIDASESPKDLYGNFDWLSESQQIKLKDFHIEDPRSMHIQVSTMLDIDKKVLLEPVKVKVNYAFFPNVYENYIQSFLFDTNAADLETSGNMQGEIIVDQLRVTQADLDLNHISLADKQSRFSITNLNGNVGWGDEYDNKQYTIGFEAIDLYKLRLGKADFKLVNHHNYLTLTESVKVPLLDGDINIESFQLDHPGKINQSAAMDISLTPVSMAKLSARLGWPEMTGNLAGYAPNMIYKKGNIEIGGALLVRGFGGTTTIHNLSVQDLFSVTPKLYADIKLNDLDLKSLTETFSFGEITGKMSGRIDDMQFVSWAPVQFDAWFATPDNDSSRHRISQTAVDNLTQVGNGAPNVLSKSFLKFFDSFGYEKLGLGCKLISNTCKMRGVARIGEGFYIVKGSGLPRIDIVGYTDEVSWSVLTDRLKRVVKTQDIVIN